MAIVQVEGARIAYDTYGSSKPAVVFLHGFPLNRLMWAPQVEALRGVGRLVVPDMRGMGSSELSNGTTSMERMADDVHGLVESLDLAPVVLVGLSMGGYVALSYYRKYREEVRALVLVDTRAEADDEKARENRTKMIEEVQAKGPSAVATAMIPKLLSEEAQKDAEVVAEVRRMIETTSPAGIIGALRGMAERPDSTDLLGEIAVPTLVVVGSEDTVTPPEGAEAFAAAIPDAQFEVIDGAGHLSTFEKPDEFNDLVREFLEELPNGESDS